MHAMSVTETSVVSLDDPAPLLDKQCSDNKHSQSLGSISTSTQLFASLSVRVDAEEQKPSIRRVTSVRSLPTLLACCKPQSPDKKSRSRSVGAICFPSSPFCLASPIDLSPECECLTEPDVDSPLMQRHESPHRT